MKQGYKYSWEEIEVLKNNWKQLSDMYKGNFRSIRINKVNMLRRFELEVPYSSGIIQLKTDEFKPLKIIYHFQKEYNEHFLVYPEDFTDKIGKLFGYKEFEIGIKKFDNKYILKGSNKEIIFKILTLKMRNYLLNHYISNFILEKENSCSFLELNIVVNELNTSEMNECINIFKECIDTIELELQSLSNEL